LSLNRTGDTITETVRRRKRFSANGGAQPVNGADGNEKARHVAMAGF